MKTLLKVIGVVVVVVIILLVALILARNVIAKAVLVKAMESAAGLNVTIQKVDVGFPQPTIAVEGITIFNPAGYSVALMADIPELFLDCRLLPLLRNEVLIREMRFNVKELNIIQMPHKTLNIQTLGFMLPPKKADAKPPLIKIDTLHLKIAKITYFDYVKTKEPLRYSLTMNLDQTFHDVTNPAKISQQVINNLLLNINIAPVNAAAQGAKAALGAFQQNQPSVTDKLKQIFQQ